MGIDGLQGACSITNVIDGVLGVPLHSEAELPRLPRHGASRKVNVWSRPAELALHLEPDRVQQEPVQKYKPS